MPTFAPVRPYYAPRGRVPRVRQGARLSHYGLGQESLYGGGVVMAMTPPAPAPPGLPAGYDPTTGLIAAGASGDTPAVSFGPASSVPAGAALPIGTFLTYTVNYEQNMSGAFTSNQGAIASMLPMLAGVGLNVVNTQTPFSLNPLSSNQAVLTVQVQGGGISLQSAKNLLDNAVVNGIGASIISSSIAVGQSNSITTWISQNWMWVAAAAAAVLIAPRVLDDLL